jgi:hypothetical protein
MFLSDQIEMWIFCRGSTKHHSCKSLVAIDEVVSDEKIET